MNTWERLSEYQPKVLHILANTIEKDRIAHAYLFSGARGTKKKEIALVFAKSYFCLQRDYYQPCDVCLNCKRIMSRNHPDVHIIEPDGLSIKKGQIHDLQEEFAKTGYESRKKLYIIEHADKMTASAANSLLKFLEEPYPGTMAILLTEQVHHILETILSRCQLVSFDPLSPTVITHELTEEGISLSLAKLISELTSDAEEAREWSRQDWFAQARTLVLQLYEALFTSVDRSLLLVHEQWMAHFTEREKVEQGLHLLLLIYRDLLYIQVGKTEACVYVDQLKRLEENALRMSQSSVAAAMEKVLEAKKRLHTNVNTQLLLEKLVMELQEGLSFV